MKRYLLPCLLLLPLAAHAQEKEPSVDGTWVLSMTLMDNPLADTCTLHAVGKKLEGVCRMPEGEADILGEVDGRHVEWKHSALLMGNPIAYSFKGTIADDGTMSGELGIDAFGVTTSFTGKKTETGDGKA